MALYGGVNRTRCAIASVLFVVELGVFASEQVVGATDAEPDESRSVAQHEDGRVKGDSRWDHNVVAGCLRHQTLIPSQRYKKIIYPKI